MRIWLPAGVTLEEASASSGMDFLFAYSAPLQHDTAATVLPRGATSTGLMLQLQTQPAKKPGVEAGTQTGAPVQQLQLSGRHELF